MPEEVNRLVMMIEKNRLEFLDARDTTEKQITQIEGKMVGDSKAVDDGSGGGGGGAPKSGEEKPQVKKEEEKKEAKKADKK